MPDRELVFLSHSGKDKELVNYLSRRAKKLDINLYIAEREPEYEKKISDKIRRKLEESYCLLALYTINGSKSSFVNQEIGYADKAKIPYIIILEKDVKCKGFIYGQETIPLDRNKPKEALKEALRYIKKNEAKLRALLPPPPKLSGWDMASYLDVVKKDFKDARFFRPYGPMAVDFEKGYVYIRPEVNEILEKLKKDRIVCITGDPAAGKTVILHSIGHSLIGDNNPNVYIISLEEEKRPELDAIRSLPEGAVVILDDCHLDTSYVEEFLRPPLPRCSLLLSSRPFEPPWFKEERIGIGSAIYERMNYSIRIKPEAAARKIIELFTEKKRLEISEKIKEQLVKEYSSNLMLLSWALETYEKYKSVERRKIYEAVKDWLCPPDKTEGFYRDLKAEEREKIEPKKSAEIFLSLSAFYQYEIPVARQFLSELLKIRDERDNEISILLKSKTISGDIESLGLPHSAIAKLFIESAGKVSYLKGITETIKSNIVERSDKAISTLSWDIVLLYSYMWKFPEKVNYFIGRLPKDVLNILQRLKDFPFLLKEIFEKAEYFDQRCYWKYEDIVRDKFREVNEISTQIFTEKINKWEDPEATVSLLYTLKEINYKMIDKLLDSLEPAIFTEKINKWEDPWAIAYLLGNLKGINYKRIDELLDSLEPVFFAEKIKGWEAPGDIASLLKTLKDTNYKRIDELLDSLEPAIFTEKIKGWEVFWVSYLLKTLEELNYPHLKELKKLLKS